MNVNTELVYASQQRAEHSGLLGRLSKQPSEQPRKSTPQQREARLDLLLSQTGNPVVARTQLERLIGGNDLVGVSYLELGVACARSICRIHLRDANGNTIGFGTGFLVAPGVLMTNHHVIGSAAEATGATAEFDFELDLYGKDKVVAEFDILLTPEPLTHKDLDFCVASVADRSKDGTRSLDEFGWLPLDPTPGKAFVGEYLTIIQHPGGERKQVCVRENQLLRYDDQADTIWYKTDTVAGSSGSPAFNNSWQVVALHHSGVPKTDSAGRWLTIDNRVWDRSMDESQVAWIANEGIRISRIVALLSESMAAHPLAQRVLARPVPRLLRSDERRRTATASMRSSDGDSIRLVVPVEISVRVGDRQDGGQSTNPLPASPSGVPSPATHGVSPAQPPAGLEAVVVDQTDYAKRPGFNPLFLGAGKLRVPLPTLSAQQAKQVAPVKGSPSGELKYWNYSVVMHKQRRLAFFSVVNVDAALRPQDAGRDGDRWYVDTRLDGKYQLDQSFYGEQSSFESAKPDRTKNPFDRGHLVRRLDAQWGKPVSVASRNGNDSFHFCNCSPQHWQYNQGSKRWLGLEDYVITKFAGGGKACVINGPVFDAPLSQQGTDGGPTISLKGKGVADPTFGGVFIPKMFFKIVACARSGQRLAVAAFLMSQEDLLRTMGKRLKGLGAAPAGADEVLTDKEAKLYQVRVVDIEHLTGLSFGSLAGADGGGATPEASIATRPRRIQGFEDLDL